jgi:tol-pal system protein YbgF
MLITYVKRVLMVVMLSSITTFAFADDAAPVYDADNMPSQFDGQPSSSSSAVATPAPAAPLATQEQSYFPSPTLTMEQRIGRVEQQLTNIQHATGSAKTEELQSEVQSLRGQVEQLNHQIQQLQNHTRTMYSDLEKRMKKTHDTTLATNNDPLPADNVDTNTTKKPDTIAKATSKEESKEKTIAAADSQTQPNVAEEQQTYQTAYDLIKAKKYNEAISALQKMLQKYPSGQFAANAHYWLGELYGLTGKNEESSKEFRTIVSNFPDSPKVADAQLKLGMIYASDLKWRDAKTQFKKVVSRYPGTASAHLASEQLKQLKQAGH